MKLTVLTMWYNEEKLAPFFFKHYRDLVDEIVVIVDADTDDNTREICKKNGAIIKEFKFPDGMDDILKRDRLNEELENIKSDWVLGVDADEFVFAPFSFKIKPFLEEADRAGADLVFTSFANVFKHKTEGKLDINKSIVHQRQHGSFNISEWGELNNRKANVIKPYLRWEVGFHLAYGWHNIYKNCLLGVHWAMADVDLAIERRIYGRKLRMSKRNKELKLSWHLFNITEEQIRKECKKHENDPNILGKYLSS
jgi:glycosyltransferase involved in cell wall biosynthesis